MTRPAAYQTSLGHNHQRRPVLTREEDVGIFLDLLKRPAPTRRKKFVMPLGNMKKGGDGDVDERLDDEPAEEAGG